MRFYEIRHGAWMGLYGVHVGKKASRVVFGNPMIAITMLRHDVRAGLYVPVEALVVEREEGLTEVVQDLPSSLIGGGEDNVPLREAAEELDRTLEKLWEWVAEEGGRSDSVEV
jgi:exonuclease V